MFTKRTDLAIEAHELWQESAGKTTRLAGVKATEKKIQGYPVTQVDILDREGEAALGKPAGSYRTLDLTAFWQRGDGFFDRAVRAVGQANHRNPLPIFIPCHRVIGASGKLTGYGGGLDLKQKLLELEGAR